MLYELLKCIIVAFGDRLVKKYVVLCQYQIEKGESRMIEQYKVQPQVIVIPSNNAIGTDKKIRAAAYARVSTDSSDQANSFLTQLDYYRDFITKNPEMTFVDLYADEGITGTKIDKREDFKRMINDCLDGKIDLIFVKSVSRFARNTLDGIDTIRKLKRIGVDVVFEENEIDTRIMTSESELITAYSIAQEEAVSTSKNVAMGVRNRMKNGTFKQGSAPYGYKVNDGEFTIIEEQAEIVKLIFLAYKEGKSLKKISKELTEMGIKKNNGTSNWNPNMVKYIITNVRYKGDALYQKTFTEGFPFKSVPNRGELDQYYIKNANPPIVSAELFDLVNDLLRKQSKRFNRAKTEEQLELYNLSKLICCGECGCKYRIKKGTSRVYWVCRNHDLNSKNCSNSQISEEKVYEAFIKMYNRLVMNKEYVLGKMLATLQEYKSKSRQNKKEVSNINEQIAYLTEQILVTNKLNSKGYIESALYHEKINEYQTEITELKKEKKRHLVKDECDNAIKETENIIKTIELNGSIYCFKKKIAMKILNRIVANGSKLTFELKNGMKIDVDSEG